MSLTTVLLVAALALGIGALGFAVGMLLAPRIGRWAERIMDGDGDDDDDE